MEPSLGASLLGSIPSSLGNSWKPIKTKSMLFPKAIFTAISATAHYHLCSTCQPGSVTHTCARGVNWLNVLTESMYMLRNSTVLNSCLISRKVRWFRPVCGFVMIKMDIPPPPPKLVPPRTNFSKNKDPRNLFYCKKWTSSENFGPPPTDEKHRPWTFFIWLF